MTGCEMAEELKRFAAACKLAAKIRVDGDEDCRITEYGPSSAPLCPRQYSYGRSR